MKKYLVILTLSLLSFSFNSYSQQIGIGFKMDIMKYIWLQKLPPHEGGRSITSSPAFFLKFSTLFFDKFELELDVGYQLGDRFAGVEAAFLAKYRFWENIYPFVSYLNHQNDGHDGTGDGTSHYTYHLIGAGAEFRLNEIFSADIGYYYPVGERGYDYEYLSAGAEDFKYTNTSEINSVMRIGIILNIIP